MVLDGVLQTWLCKIILRIFKDKLDPSIGNSIWVCPYLQKIFIAPSYQKNYRWYPNGGHPIILFY